VSADVAERDDVAMLMERIDRGGLPLAGIVHAAGVLDDGMLSGQSWERFLRVMAPKVAGAWHLHEQTRQRALDFFVLFSAGASILGSPGQGNYAAANAFMDALAQERRAAGMPALAINWGPWADVGMAAALQSEHRERHAEMGIESISREHGLATLRRLLAETRPQVAVLRVRDWDAMAALTTTPPPLLAELARSADPQIRDAGSSELEIKRRLEAASPAERREIVVSYVREAVCRVMGIERSAPPGLDRPLSELGLDSLMATQIKNQLDRIAGSVPLARLLDGPSINELVDVILSPGEREVADAEIPIAAAADSGAGRDARSLLSKLPDLSDQQVDSLLDELLAEGNAANE
jgi:hypothetical protein